MHDARVHVTGIAVTTRSRACVLAILTVLVLCCASTFSAPALAQGSAVSLTAFECSGSSLAPVPGPAGVYIDDQSTSHATPIQIAPHIVRAFVLLKPGYHKLYVRAPNGYVGTTFVDVLPGHARHVALELCSISLVLWDSMRSISVVLPSDGLLPSLLLRTADGRYHSEPMYVDDGVAYATYVGDGDISLLVAYGTQVCSYSLASTASNWRDQHLRFILPLDALLPFSRAPLRCGVVAPLEFASHDYEGPRH